ncbi:ATP-binding protein [Pleionea sediminis]|uniref:ATP-binding protein n=1 Tax=Pleionea sediminis TaxID=2569479 RepID=UPI0013DDC670|nr:ATP-binding protein [Pleionea sediminis]
MVQDENGVLWLSNYQGLYYYNGTELNKAKSSDEFIHSRYIYDMEYQEGGYIWIYGKGVRRYSISSGETDIIVGDDEFVSTPSFVDSRGNVWFNFKNRTLYRTNSSLEVKEVKTNIQDECQRPLENYIAGILEDKEGKIHFIYCGGIFSFDYKTERVSLVSDLNFRDSNINRSDLLWLSLSDGLYAHTSNQVYTLNLQENTLSTVECNLPNIENAIAKIHPLKDKTIFIASGNGFYLCDIESNQSQFFDTNNSQLYSDSVFSILQTMDNTIWIGTGTGLNKLQPEDINFQFVPLSTEQTSSDHAYHISTFNEEIWIGGGKGLYIFNERGDFLKHYEFFHGSSAYIHKASIHKIVEFDKNSVLLSTETGHFVIDKSTKKIISDSKQSDWPLPKYSNPFISSTRNENTIWLGSYEFLASYNVENQQYDLLSEKFPKAFENLSVRDVSYINKQLFMASRKGIFRFDKDGMYDYQIPFEVRGILKGPKSNSLYFYSDNLYELDIETGNYDLLTYQDIELKPVSLELDKNDTLWVATEQQLFSVKNDQVSKVTPAFKSAGYILKASHMDENKNIFFGTINGFVKINQHHPKVRQFEPKVILTSVNIDSPIGNVPVNYLSSYQAKSTKLQLPSNNRNLSFKVSAIDYNNSENIRYQYRVKNLIDKWRQIDSDNRVIQLNEIPNGNYLLELKSTNGARVWNKQSITIAIEALPKWWETMWFKVSLLVLGIYFLYLLQKWRNRSLIAKQKQLEETVNLRTAELTERNQQVEDLLETKDRFIANITHEFKTPLTLILGPIENLKNSIKTNNNELSIIQRNALRLLRLVEHLLDFSKTHHSEEKVQDVNGLMELITEPFKTLAASKGLSLSYSKCSNVIELQMSEESFEKVISNLISNAIKYNKKNGTIDIECRYQDDQLIISVSDTGMGINERDKDAIFERFNRISQSQFEKVSGAGIGLSLVKHLVEQSDGSITVESTVGEGSTFKITLPANINSAENIKEVQVNEQLLQIELENSLSIGDKSLKDDEEVDHKTQVLIVEDNKDLCAHIAQSLGPNYQVSFAFNGKEGLIKASKNIPDIIISDVMMPEMDGYEFCRTIKNNDETSHIPIILLTALSDSDSRIKGFENLADEFLTKPFNKHELVSRVENILAIRRILQTRLGNDIIYQTKEKLSGPETNQDKANKVQSDKEQLFISKIETIVERHYTEESFSAKNLYSETAMSERQLQRKLKAISGLTPAEFIRAYRLKKSTELLIQGQPVGQVFEQVGFSSPTYFSNCFKAQYNMTPSEYKNSQDV